MRDRSRRGVHFHGPGGFGGRPELSLAGRGDGVMAVFGGPVRGDQDADRAVRAATETTRQLCEVNRDTAAAVYTERCRTFRERPPAPDWDGVWTMTEK